jgi:hypothetical protein
VQIPGRNDLKQLCEVLKTLYDYAILKLYENIVIWVEDEWHLERAEVEPFLGTSSKSTGHLARVRIDAVLEQEMVMFFKISERRSWGNYVQTSHIQRVHIESSWAGQVTLPIAR